MSMKIKSLKWAVVVRCHAYQDINGKRGIPAKWQSLVAVFNYPCAAQDYINNVIPESQRKRFEVINIGDANAVKSCEMKEITREEYTELEKELK